MSDLLQYIRLIRERFYIVLICAIVAGVAGLIFSVIQPPRYEATVSLLINPVMPNPLIAFLDQSVQGSSEASLSRLTASYGEYLKSRAFGAKAVEQIGIATTPDILTRAISSSRITNTNVFKISVIWDSPAETQRIANGLAGLFVTDRRPVAPPDEQERSAEYYRQAVEKLRAQRDTVQNSTLSPDAKSAELDRIQAQLTPLEDLYAKWSQVAASGQLSRQGRTDSASIMDAAPLPQLPLGLSGWRSVLVGGLGGALLGVVMALCLAYLDDTIKTPADVARNSELPVLAAIPRFASIEGIPLRVWTPALRSSEFEIYRTLRTNVQFATIDNPLKAVLIVSATAQEGKTTSLVNLAVAMASAGTNVIAVDTDLRRPTFHKVFNLPNTTGVTSLLVDQQLELDAALQSTEFEKLSILTSGPIPPNPAELLGSQQFSKLVERLRTRADLLLFDSAPILAVTDGVLLSNLLGHTIIVVNSGHTATRAFRDTLQSLAAGGGIKMLGVILNAVRAGHTGYYYNSRRYYSSDESPEPVPSNNAHEEAPRLDRTLQRRFAGLFTAARRPPRQ